MQAGGIIIAGDYIPRGYDVGCCLYAVNHDEDQFLDSYTFLLECWLPISSINSDEHHDVAVIKRGTSKSVWHGYYELMLKAWPRKSGRNINKDSLPEMIEWCRRIGHEV